jgi:hypothetical protein
LRTKRYSRVIDADGPFANFGLGYKFSGSVVKDNHPKDGGQENGRSPPARTGAGSHRVLVVQDQPIPQHYASLVCVSGAANHRCDDALGIGCPADIALEDGGVWTN